uniref:Ancillary SecYEG translocon subunit n=1 Tax=Candidatus Kentrum sp. TUN TaxID=2126343 RepID=A0A451A537_9GAMM|nr:MAG: Putative negative regulator of RcsB-dependent stress response [Candidatus Kentron sp. TUN]VFK61313.1 MAG: Putative negative regulator of RcsB-dependent stress response [Candidatus Kentron sp. TUN]VFK70196.1 MAG: Putative negative regulator of RcsB-dependent stress response [Candidatus Kentron sp. TUN]
MMPTYQSEQEQLESLQKWWKENSRSVIFGVLLGVAGVIGWSSWQAYMVRQAEKTSFSYQQLVNSVGNGAYEEAIKQGESLISEFPDTGYAALASLVMARVAFEQNNIEKAKVHLRWVLDQRDFSPVQSVARLRLARLLASEKKWVEAAALLDGDTGELLHLYEEMRGDIFLAQGNMTEARSAFKRSLTGAGLADRRFQGRVRMKLTDLGSMLELKGASDR